MRLEKVMIVFRKDWLDISRNWQIMLPMLILPLILAVVLPAVLTSIPAGNTSSFENNLTQSLSADVKAQIAGLDSGHAIAYVMLLVLFAPFFLIIPLMSSSVISADSFAGEKERKTTEALLATPLTDSELFVGKIMVAFVPSMIVTILSFAIYSAIVDFMFIGTGLIPLPNVSWMLLIFLLAPAISLAGIGMSVIISSRVKGFREAQQLSAMMVIPILALLFGQISGIMFLGPYTILALSAATLVIDAVILRIGIGTFRRESLLEKMA